MSAIVMLTPGEIDALVRKAVRSEFALLDKGINAAHVVNKSVEDEPEAEKVRESRVYFVRAGEAGSITSMDVPARVASLQTSHGERLTILATILGDRRRERGLHERFDHLRGLGEWFRPGPDLLEFIATLSKGEQ